MFGRTKRLLLRSCVRGQCKALNLFSSKFRYQPLPSALIAAGARGSSARECTDRLRLIVNYLPAVKGNVLDIGSNAGYYLFELAKQGYVCHGIESDPDLAHYTSLMAYLMDCTNVSCEIGKLDLSYVERMPRYDVILCLSVMHHIILAEGFETADAILQRLATKTTHVLFFEMGQSNEISADWSARLPVMTPDAETWISAWLGKSGFSRVETVGTSRTTAPRFIIAAYP